MFFDFLKKPQGYAYYIAYAYLFDSLVYLLTWWKPYNQCYTSRHRPIIIKMMRSAANGTIERITQPQAHLCSGLTHPYQRGLNYKHLLAKRDDSISFPNHILSSVIFISNVASVSYLFMTLNKDNKGQNMLRFWNVIVISSHSGGLVDFYITLNYTVKC